MRYSAGAAGGVSPGSAGTSSTGAGVSAGGSVVSGSRFGFGFRFDFDFDFAFRFGRFDFDFGFFAFAFRFVGRDRFDFFGGIGALLRVRLLLRLHPVWWSGRFRRVTAWKKGPGLLAAASRPSPPLGELTAVRTAAASGSASASAGARRLEQVGGSKIRCRPFALAAVTCRSRRSPRFPCRRRRVAHARRGADVRLRRAGARRGRIAGVVEKVGAFLPSGQCRRGSSPARRPRRRRSRGRRSPRRRRSPRPARGPSRRTKASVRRQPEPGNREEGEADVGEEADDDQRHRGGHPDRRETGCAVPPGNTTGWSNPASWGALRPIFLTRRSSMLTREHRPNSPLPKAPEREVLILGSVSIQGIKDKSPVSGNRTFVRLRCRTSPGEPVRRPDTSSPRGRSSLPGPRSYRGSSPI